MYNKLSWLKIIATLGLVCTGLDVNADNWPGWRGPNQNGISSESDVPLEWSESKNVRWKISIPGVGHSSPIVWNDAIFVTTAMVEQQTRHLLKIDRETGEILWNRLIATAPIEVMHRDNTPASATPITDGQHVFVAFSVEDKILVASLDFAGQFVWQTNPGTFLSQHGFCTNLVLDGDRLLLSGLQDGEDAFVAALDKSTGKTLWKVPRPRKTRSFSTPCLCEIDDRPALLLSGGEQTIAYDRTNGETLFELEGPAEKTVSSIVCCPDSKLAFVCGGRDNKFYAIELSHPSAAQPTKRIVWQSNKALPYMTSPLTDNGLLHVLSDEGVYRCYRAETGEVLKELRAVGPTRASMVSTPERIYIMAESGRTTVIANDASWNVLARNEIGEDVVASPAISNGDLFIRSKSSLLLIRELK